MALLVMDELLKLGEMERFEDWLAHLKLLTRKLGYSNFLIGLKPAPTDACQQVLIYSDYPDAWRTRYDAESYAAVDPVVQHCLNANRPLLWNRENYRGPSESEFFEEAAAHGLQQGLALPLHGPRGEAGMLCLKPDESGEQATAAMIQSLPMATLLRDYAMEGMLRARIECSEPVHLTSREKEVLQWSAAGKTTWEISMILSCTTSAIDFHFKNIRRKFQVSSRQMAVLKAIQQKSITP